MTDTILQIRSKSRPCIACEVRGRHLAPAMYEFDNLEDIERILEIGMVGCEEWSYDGRSGMITIPGVGSVRIGGFIVVDGDEVSVYGSLEEMMDRYNVVMEEATIRREEDGKTGIRTGKTA